MGSAAGSYRGRRREFRLCRRRREGRLRAVEESARLPDRVFVESGLKAGETVIVGGTNKVYDSAAVTCKEAK